MSDLGHPEVVSRRQTNRNTISSVLREAQDTAQRDGIQHLAQSENERANTDLAVTSEV